MAADGPNPGDRRRVPNLELMSYLLQAFGSTIVTATDGEVGEEIARDRLPELSVLAS